MLHSCGTHRLGLNFQMPYPPRGIGQSIQTVEGCFRMRQYTCLRDLRLQACSHASPPPASSLECCYRFWVLSMASSKYFFDSGTRCSTDFPKLLFCWMSPYVWRVDRTCIVRWRSVPKLRSIRQSSAHHSISSVHSPPGQNSTNAQAGISIVECWVKISGRG